MNSFVKVKLSQCVKLVCIQLCTYSQKWRVLGQFLGDLGLVSVIRVCFLCDCGFGDHSRGDLGLISVIMVHSIGGLGVVVYALLSWLCLYQWSCSDGDLGQGHSDYNLVLTKASFPCIFVVVCFCCCLLEFPLAS